MRKLATYEAIVENGHVILPPNADIPDKTLVYVMVPDVETQKTLHIRSPRLVHPEQAKDFVKEIIEDTSDAGV